MNGTCTYCDELARHELWLRPAGRRAITVHHVCDLHLAHATTPRPTGMRLYTDSAGANWILLGYIQKAPLPADAPTQDNT